MASRADGWVKTIQDLLADVPVYCFVGAGFSLNHPEMKGWEDLFKEIGNHLEEEVYSGKEIAIHDFKLAVNDKDFKRAGDIYKTSHIDYSRKQKRMTQLLINNKRPTNVHLNLLRIRFKGIFTTNYDHLLEDAYSYIYGQSNLPYLPHDIEDENFLFGEQFFIAKLHGDAARWNSMVIGEKDYRYAKWAETVKRTVNGNAIIVLGISGRDPIINDFLLNLSLQTRILILMSSKSIIEYHNTLRATSKVPDNFIFAELSHKEIAEVISLLKPKLHGVNIKDCKWGEMPPLPPRRLYFGHNEGLMRKFLFSQDKVAFIHNSSGNGVSSFLAQSLRDKAFIEDSIIYRIEAKEYLPLDAYVLHLITSVEEVYEHYKTLRHNTTAEWSLESEAKAISEAFSKIDRAVVLAIEHADRLSKNNILFFEKLLKYSSDAFKLIFTAKNELASQIKIDIRIALDKPSDKQILTLCDNHNIDPSIIHGLTNINDSLSFNFLVSAGGLLMSKATNISDIKKIVQNSDQNSISKIIVNIHQGDEVFMQVLKTAVLFRTPRSLRSLQICSEINDEQKLSQAIEKLIRYGILMYPDDICSKYAMSTGMRRAMLAVLKWEDGERQRISHLIGQRFKKNAIEELESHNNTSQVTCKVIPYLSTALYHYLDAGSLESYVDLVWKVRENLIHMNHSEVLRYWLSKDNLPSIKDESINYKINYIGAKLSRCQALPNEYEKYLNLAENNIAEIEATGRDCSKEKAKLKWDRGIMLTMKRSYKDALTLFENISNENNDTTTRDYYRSRLRMAQTMLSLGKLKTAEKILNDLRRILQEHEDRKDINKDTVFHSYSMLWRHFSTLNTLRLLFIKRAPSEKQSMKEELLKSALDASDKNYKYSQSLEREHSRFGGGDETGIGISYLKKAQAFYAARKYKEVPELTKRAASILAGYPNSRWWRMTCHDYAAKSLAIIGECEGATEEVKNAENIWLSSAKEDLVRKSEIEFTKGLIHINKNEIESAIVHLQESVTFPQDSPCIKIVHLMGLADAYLKDNNSVEANNTLEISMGYHIEW